MTHKPQSMQRIALAQLAGGPETVVLCPTARLAAEVRRAHGEVQMRLGVTTWRALNGATPVQWLDHLCSTALLRGEIPAQAVPGMFLTRPQELALWQRVIAEDEQLDDGVFDRDGLAQTAMDADRIATEWRVAQDALTTTAEAQALTRWRQAFARMCQQQGWLGAVAAQQWRIGCVERGIGGLPVSVGVAGFTHIEPDMRRLLDALTAGGVTLFELDLACATATHEVSVVTAVDVAGECQAVAQWASQQLVLQPAAQLRVVTADPAVLPALERALESALCPQRQAQLLAPLEPPFARSAAASLSESPLAMVALRLLQLAVNPRQITQTDFSNLLRQPGWSLDVDEADARAQLEVALRDQLPPEFSLAELRRVVQRQAAGLAGLQQHLQQLSELPANWPRLQTAGAWADAFGGLLAAIQWPGQRPRTNSERATGEGLAAALDGLSALHAMLGPLSAGAALKELRKACRERTLTVPRERPASIVLATLNEGVGVACDGLWVMGLLDGRWPPGPQPCPLLPADVQRRAGVIDACGDLLLCEAQHIQDHWRRNAPVVIFSWPQRSGESPLRPSPLLAGLPRRVVAENVLRPISRTSLETIADDRAPPVKPGEHVRGGTALLQAQAICPAWAFYRYRLGAAVLPAPTFGIDPRTHGQMLHAALDCFWTDRGSAELTQMNEAARRDEVARVVATGMAEVMARDAQSVAGRRLSPRLAALEAQLLERLLFDWLKVEDGRSEFRVIAHEVEHRLDLEGIALRLVIDRVDQLSDGRQVIIDYKSGNTAGVASWADERLREPQLPLYAALVYPDVPLAAIALARVHPQEPKFVGVAPDADGLPGMAVIGSGARNVASYSRAGLTDWAALRQRWALAVRQLAGEIRDGVAAVQVADESDLNYCDVLPLLRLAERRTQWRLAERAVK